MASPPPSTRSESRGPDWLGRARGDTVKAKCREIYPQFSQGSQSQTLARAHRRLTGSRRRPGPSADGASTVVVYRRRPVTKKTMDTDSLCGPSPAEAVDEGRRESLERTARDDEARNVEMRESGECLPSIDEAFPARPPKPPPPPHYLRPPEVEQHYSSCFLACTGAPAADECLACGARCGASFFGSHARCGDCGATFCGDCRGAGLRKLPGIVCDDSGWRCVDEDACENQAHSLRRVRSYWGDDVDDVDDDDVDAPRPSEAPPEHLMVTL